MEPEFFFEGYIPPQLHYKPYLTNFGKLNVSLIFRSGSGRHGDRRGPASEDDVLTLSCIVYLLDHALENAPPLIFAHAHITRPVIMTFSLKDVTYLAEARLRSSYSNISKTLQLIYVYHTVVQFHIHNYNTSIQVHCHSIF